MVPEVAETLRDITSLDVFDDWYAAGPEADDYWRDYEKRREHSFAEAVKGHAAQNTFNFDKCNLDRCDAACLVMPAGKSAHLELGYVIGSGKPGFILLADDPDRFDVMYAFATEVVYSIDELLIAIQACETKVEGGNLIEYDITRLPG